jgi:hypothetical protein
MGLFGRGLSSSAMLAEMSHPSCSVFACDRCSEGFLRVLGSGFDLSELLCQQVRDKQQRHVRGDCARAAALGRLRVR